MLKFYMVLFIVFAATAAVMGQSSFSVLSDRQVLVTVVPQGDCPLKIEDAVAIDLSGRTDILYKVRNTGAKSIKVYTIVKWFGDNTGTVTTGGMPNGGGLIGPNQTSGTMIGVDLSKSEKTQAKIVDQNIAFLMISEITFEDGTVFSMKNKLDTLEQHLQKIERIYYNSRY